MFKPVRPFVLTLTALATVLGSFGALHADGLYPAPLTDAELSAARGRSNTTHLSLNKTECEDAAAVSPQVPWYNCGGHCVVIGPPVPCIQCDPGSTTNNVVTETVNSGGNFVYTNTVNCGQKSLGGCTYTDPNNETGCGCHDEVASGVCLFNLDKGSLQARVVNRLDLYKTSAP